VLFLREHLWYFAPDTMRAVLEKTGFEMVETRPNRVRFSLRNVFVRLGQYRGWVGRAARKAGELPGMGGVGVRFPIGEMVVIARKKKSP